MQASITYNPASVASVRIQHHPLKIVVLGDSLVYGFGDPEGGGWVERLRRQWMYAESSGHVVYNLGVRGNRVSQVCDRLEHEFRHRGELRNRVPDVLILSVGVNDSSRVQSLNGRNYTDFAEYQKIVQNLLDQARCLCPVLFVGMVPVDEHRMPFQGCLYYNHADQYHYKEAMKQACLERQIPYLDIFESWLNRGELWWRSRLSEDGLHPNVEGYKTLFEEVLNWEPIHKLTTSHETFTHRR